MSTQCMGAGTPPCSGAGGALPRGAHRGGRQRRKRGLGAQAQAGPGPRAAGAPRSLRRARAADRRGEQRLQAMQRVVRAHLGGGRACFRGWQMQLSRVRVCSG